MTEQESNAEWVRTVECKDGSRRSTAARVYLSEDNLVAVHAPPGEVALLSPLAVTDLIEVLRAAQLRALKNGEMG